MSNLNFEIILEVKSQKTQKTLKITQKDLYCNFKVQEGLRQKNLQNWKSRAPPNYVGRIRSNLSFEFI